MLLPTGFKPVSHMKTVTWPDMQSTIQPQGASGLAKIKLHLIKKLTFDGISQFISALKCSGTCKRYVYSNYCENKCKILF